MTDAVDVARPKRIQRQRTKGWRMPDGAVYVGRPTKWGNPYQVMLGCSRENALHLYRRHIEENLEGRPIDFSPLRGKDLACWCPLDQPCHADVLLELANQVNS